ncbi:MAG: thiamine pyrophosphate-dependent enzyme, partial [Bacteroidia bacterium]
MNFEKFNQYDEKQLIEIYEALVRPRMIEEKMLKLLRQGQVSKWFSGIGQEAIAVGATLALDDDEYVMPNHRNLGVFTTRGIPLDKLLYQWRGDSRGFTKGRDRSFHFGTNEYHIAGMISHLGSMLSVADGVALANKLKGENKVTLAFSGDGGTSEGEFHEALNLAAVWELPVIFLIENNGYGLSTPSDDQFKCKSLADKGIGYGIESKTIDGNNILEVYSTVQSISKDLRLNPRPFLLECKTFRMRGHEEASGIKYVPNELIDYWSAKDPIENYRGYLIENQQLKENLLVDVENKITNEISEAVRVFDEPVDITVDCDTELSDVYMSSNKVEVDPVEVTSNIRFIDAISEGLRSAMKKYPNLVLMGQDIAEYGGVFKITDGFVKAFGKD